MPSPPGEAPPADLRLARLLEHGDRLHRLITRMSSALRAQQVAELVVDEGTDALHAHSGGFWMLGPDQPHLQLLRSKNYPVELLPVWKDVPIDPLYPLGDAVLRQQPVWISSRADHSRRYPASAERTSAMGLSAYSLCVVPILIETRVLGAFSLTFGDERPFDEDERGYLTLLAQHSALGLERAHLYESETRARQVAEAAQERAMFLSRASALLGSSLDYEETLRNVAALAVPSIGDWCAVELLEPDGTAKQVAVAHVDPAKVELAHELRRRYPPHPDEPTGVPNVLRTGVSEVYWEIPDELLVAGARDAEHLRIARELGLRSIIIVPIKDRDAVLGAISFVLAHTDRRYGPDDVRMAEQLGERAGAAIANAKLYREAQAAVKVRDDFMLIAGHELRTPLAALSLHLEALVATRDDATIESVRQRGAKLRNQTERIGRLVEDLLDVSKVAAGRLVLEPEPLDLGAVVCGAVERMRDDFERARTEVHLDCHELHGTWDRSRLEQVVNNLLTNAVKYGKGMPIDVSVRREGNDAVLTVVDQGIGIAPEDQPRIFERFERAVSTRHFGGLGLGLWITRQLIEAHGGTITVHSEPGRGATFVVKLPLAP